MMSILPILIGCTANSKCFYISQMKSTLYIMPSSQGSDLYILVDHCRALVEVVRSVKIVSNLITFLSSLSLRTDALAALMLL